MYKPNQNQSNLSLSVYDFIQSSLNLVFLLGIFWRAQHAAHFSAPKNGSCPFYMVMHAVAILLRKKIALFAAETLFNTKAAPYLTFIF